MFFVAEILTTQGISNKVTKLTCQHKFSCLVPFIRLYTAKHGLFFITVGFPYLNRSFIGIVNQVGIVLGFYNILVSAFSIISAISSLE